MINAIYTQTSCFGMPMSARVRTAAWTRALPMTTGVAVLAMGTGVDAKGTGASKHAFRVNDGTFPGTSVWSPPT